MLHRLCEPPSIPLSFSLATILPRRGTYHFCFTWKNTGIPQASTHRLRLGLPGYLIPFAPLAFVSQRQYRTRKPPSPPMFFPISMHFTATLGIPLSSFVLKSSSFKRNSSVEPRAYTPDLLDRLHTLYAQ